MKRVDPVHDDEGVDMQSDICETDSLEEEEGEEEGGGGGGSSSSTSPTDQPASPVTMGVGGVTVTITSPSPEKNYKEERKMDGDFNEEMRVPDEEGVVEGLARSLSPSENSSEAPSSVTTDEDSEGGDTKGGGVAKHKNKDPWEIVDDPFVPIGIEQVPTHNSSIINP